jgi:hypothetical protein
VTPKHFWVNLTTGKLHRTAACAGPNGQQVEPCNTCMKKVLACF